MPSITRETIGSHRPADLVGAMELFDALYRSEPD